MNRREFLEAVTAAAVLPSLAAQDAHEWGVQVCDLHFHLRPQPAANLAHLDGAGIANANLLTRGRALDQVKALQAAAPGRFTWFSSYDVTQPDAEQVLTQAVKSGAQGFGEMKFHVAADGPELRRMYALAADLRVPILIHFQEVDHVPNEGTWATGLRRPSNRSSRRIRGPRSSDMRTRSGRTSAPTITTKPSIRPDRSSVEG